ncbi:hypothetical protein OVA26_16330 [Microbacterium sp. SL62]|uniref:hypothetical protein n=1 Tax=Microbacterium sp. SL62 TaxID=2995139 RepID=UPI0022767BEB|nr:hypothetical protein [Microbacterium sp. SL62]MCY1718504.1 hypothetical protein [Microbacterium sp. SL62]
MAFRSTKSAKVAGRKRKVQGVASVINETTSGAAVDTLKRNEPFALPNGKSWIGLLLQADDIGGLSDKNKNDADKGQFIQLVKSGSIEVVATPAMMQDNFLGIIPSAATLDRLDEFRLLTEAPYYWCAFSLGEDGELQADSINDRKTTFAEVRAISTGQTPLQQVLPEVWSWGGGNASEFDRIVSGAPAMGAQNGTSTTSTAVLEADPLADAFATDFDPLSDVEPSDGPDLEPSFEEFSYDVATGVIDDDAEPELPFDAEQFEAQVAAAPTIDPESGVPAVELTWSDDDAAAEAEAVDDATNGYEQYLVENRERVVDEKEVRDTIARRFLSDDLDLVVDLAEFERVFNTSAEPIAFDVPSEQSDWLTTQMAQLSRQANAELAHLHQGNVDELRELYVETMALHVEKTMAFVSTENPESQYSALLTGARDDFDANRANSGQQLADRRNELVANFEAAAQTRADQAAAHARANYEDKHRPKLERDIADLSLDLDRQHEEQYSHAKSTVLEMRRKDASVRMDLGTNRIFEHLREVQAEQRERERLLLSAWNAKLSTFLDENRKEDIARAMVLADQLSRSNAVEVLKSEQAAELARVREDHAGREAELLTQLRLVREEGHAQLESRRAEYEASLNLERDRVTSGAALLEASQRQLAELSDSIKKSYEAKIAELSSARSSVESELKRTRKDHKRSNRIFALMCVVLGGSGVAIGGICGFVFALNQAAVLAP